MLYFFHQLAKRITPYMIWVWLAVPISVALFIWTLTNSKTEAQDSVMLLAATSCAWAIGLITLRAHFIHLPSNAAPGSGLFQRIKAKARRLLSWCLALAMAACTVALFVMTYKAISYYIST